LKCVETSVDKNEVLKFKLEIFQRVFFVFNAFSLDNFFYPVTWGICL